MAVTFKFNLIVIGIAIVFDYIITTMMTFLGIEPTLYGNYLTFWNALVVFWVVLPSRIESPLDNI